MHLISDGRIDEAIALLEEVSRKISDSHGADHGLVKLAEGFITLSHVYHSVEACTRFVDQHCVRVFATLLGEYCSTGRCMDLVSVWTKLGKLTVLTTTIGTTSSELLISCS